TISNFNAAGAFIGTDTPATILNAGDYYTFHHGDAATQYSSSLIESNNPIVVYSGTAVACETDISTVLPIGGCAGASDMRTRKFIDYSGDNLPYFGFILIESATTPVYLNNENIETLTGQPRIQMGTTGFYMIRFDNTSIQNPNEIIITSSGRLTTSIVQQGVGFSMSGFFSAFSDAPDQPFIPDAQEGCGVTLETTADMEPYQWYFEGELIEGATESTYIALESGNYSVRGTRDCGETTISTPLYVEVIPCTDLSITKTAYQEEDGNFYIEITIINEERMADTSVEVMDILPSGYTFVSYTSTQGTYNEETGVWEVGNMDGGESATLQIYVELNDVGILLNEATVTGENIDIKTENNRDTAKMFTIYELNPLEDIVHCESEGYIFDLT